MKVQLYLNPYRGTKFSHVKMEVVLIEGQLYCIMFKLIVKYSVSNIMILAQTVKPVSKDLPFTRTYCTTLSHALQLV